MMMHFTLPLIPSHSAIGERVRDGRPSPLSLGMNHPIHTLMGSTIRQALLESERPSFDIPPLAGDEVRSRGQGVEPFNFVQDKRSRSISSPQVGEGDLLKLVHFLCSYDRSGLERRPA